MAQFKKKDRKAERFAKELAISEACVARRIRTREEGSRKDYLKLATTGGHEARDVDGMWRPRKRAGVSARGKQTMRRSAP